MKDFITTKKVKSALYNVHKKKKISITICLKGYGGRWG